MTVRFARFDPDATSCSPPLLFLLMFHVLVRTACDHEPYTDSCVCITAQETNVDNCKLTNPDPFTSRRHGYFCTKFRYIITVLLIWLRNECSDHNCQAPHDLTPSLMVNCLVLIQLSLQRGEMKELLKPEL